MFQSAVIARSKPRKIFAQFHTAALHGIFEGFCDSVFAPSKSNELADVDSTFQGPLVYRGLICLDRKWDQHQLLVCGPVLLCMQRR